MSSVSFFTPSYVENPLSFGDAVQNFAERYFDLKGSPFWVSALKVASYATLIIPAIVLAIKLAMRCARQERKVEANPALDRISLRRGAAPPLDPAISAVLDRTPPFRGYQIGAGTRFQDVLLAFNPRPANLFFEALLGPDPTTQPGSGQIFAFRQMQGAIREEIFEQDPAAVVLFSAAGKRGRAGAREVADLREVFGNGVFRMSYGEIQQTLNSQKIFAAPMMPLLFYKALKQALIRDGVRTLPGEGGRPVRFSDTVLPYCQALIAEVRQDPGRFGFGSARDAEAFMNLTFYQMGALVVKREDFRIFLDGEGRIREREVGEADAIRLINACGIRGIHATPSPANRQIVEQTFATALQAAESGYVVFPAVGMGVWGGDPDLYWRAFLDAVVREGAPFDRIFVNPGHQTTRTGGPFNGYSGEEFQIILDETIRRYQAAGNEGAVANLKKIVNLFDRRTDVVHLSSELKAAHPDRIVSLFNASDPDVTLGNHVGEYVNRIGGAATTEENYTALGTNGLCFEGITGVHDDPLRVVQAEAR